MLKESFECYQVTPHHGTTFEGTSPYTLSDSSVLKKTRRPFSSIESFAREFAPLDNTDFLTQSLKNSTLDPASTTETSASEVPTVSVHALDILADIYAEKNPVLAKRCLEGLAGKYDTMRKGYWQFRMEKLGEVEVS